MEQEEFAMIMGFYDKIRGFILDPVKTFKRVREEEIIEAIRYYISLTIIVSILYGVVYLFMPTKFSETWDMILKMDRGISAIIIVLLMILSSIAALFLGGAWTHLWIRIFGGILHLFSLDGCHSFS